MPTLDEIEKGFWKKIDSEDNAERLILDMLPETDDLTLIVLKGHLIIEEILYSIVKLHCSFPQHIDNSRLSFSNLTSISRALIALPVQDEVFPSIGKLNSLRNELAHNLKSPKAEKLANELISMCHEVTDNSAPIPYRLRASICFIVGQLAALKAGVELLNETPNK